MSLRIVLGLIFSLLLFGSSCQSYTTGLQQSLTRADETAATAALRAIAISERAYSISNNGEYGTLQQLVDGAYMDARYGSGKMKDYKLTMNVTAKPSGASEGTYSCNADPDVTDNRAGRHFYIDSTSDGIHVNETEPATAQDKTLQ